VAEKDDITGVMLTSGKKTFFAGGDLTLLSKATRDAEELFAQLQKFKDSCAPRDAGRAGGRRHQRRRARRWLEIALPCHHRVASTSGSEIGLPEVSLGLLPGGGGVARTVRMFGVQKALMECSCRVSARKPSRPLEVGLVDELVQRRRRVDPRREGVDQGQPRRPRSPGTSRATRSPAARPANPSSRPCCRPSRPTCASRSRVRRCPAPERDHGAAVEGAQVDIDNALLIETQLLRELATGPGQRRT
jgi:3-hydroxyacyl-CoA dehydrogenase/enoyl-CoA hydratase/3-hydroxybutyryl-CoA epimerase